MVIFFNGFEELWNFLYNVARKAQVTKSIWGKLNGPRFQKKTASVNGQ